MLEHGLRRAYHAIASRPRHATRKPSAVERVDDANGSQQVSAAWRHQARARQGATSDPEARPDRAQCSCPTHPHIRSI